MVFIYYLLSFMIGFIVAMRTYMILFESLYTDVTEMKKRAEKAEKEKESLLWLIEAQDRLIDHVSEEPFRDWQRRKA